jgi:hypothetical protein
MARRISIWMLCLVGIVAWTGLVYAQTVYYRRFLFKKCVLLLILCVTSRARPECHELKTGSPQRFCPGVRLVL